MRTVSKAVIIEDDQNSSLLLKHFLEESFSDINIMASCSTGFEGIKAIQEHRPDIVFLDIDMPKLNGFEMLDLIDTKNFEVIITTAFEDYAIQAFKVSAVDYLLKPIDEKSLKTAVDRAKNRKRSKIVDNLLENISEDVAIQVPSPKRLVLPTFNGMEFVNLDEIVYCKSEGCYTHILQDGKKEILVSKRLKEIQDKLSGKEFIRVHKSYLINTEHVEKFVKSEGGYFIMTNSDHVPLSRSKREEVFSLLIN
jgi:two-component system LytT family response regulator